MKLREAAATSIELLDMESCDPELFDHIVRARKLHITFGGHITLFSSFDNKEMLLEDGAIMKLTDASRRYAVKMLDYPSHLVRWGDLVSFGYDPATKELVGCEYFEVVAAGGSQDRGDIQDSLDINYRITKNDTGMARFRVVFGTGEVEAPLDLIQYNTWNN